MTIIGFLILTILGVAIIISLSFGLNYLETNWKNVEQIASVYMALIFLIVAIPEGGYLMDYQLDYCNDFDKTDAEGNSPLFQILRDNTEIIGINEEEYYACEIGFINAKVNIQIILHSDDDTCYNRDAGFAPMTCSIEIMILNRENYLNFVNGDSYGVTSTNLLEITTTWSGIDTGSFESVDAYLPYDMYYFVINWNYRTSSGPEEIERDFESAYVSLLARGGNTNPDFRFYYSLDIDYSEENLEGNL